VEGEALDDEEWFKKPNTKNHIDFRLGALTAERESKCYGPIRSWFCGQNISSSDIKNKGGHKEIKYWNHTIPKELREFAKTPSVVILGTHRSGSSLTAGILHKLGAFMGSKLTGYEGRKPGMESGYEASGLMHICEKHYKFPTVATEPNPDFIKDVQKFFTWLRTEGRNRNATCSAIKYPTLLMHGEALLKAFPNDTKFLLCERSLDHCIASLLARSDRSGLKCTKEEAAELQSHLYKELKKCKDILRERALVVRYADTLENPRRQVCAIANFLSLAPADMQVNAAVKLVEPSYRSVGND